MATVQSRRLRRRAAANDPLDVSPRRRRGSWLPLALCGGLLALVWFAPMIIAKSALRDQMLTKVANVDGRISSRTASFGWLSGVYVKGIEIQDKRGDVVAVVPELQGNRPLWQLLTNRSVLGNFRLVKPEVTVVLDDKGTNVEDVLKHWLADASTDGPTAIDLEIVGGSVVVIDKPQNAEWLLSACDATIGVPAGPDGEIHCQAAGLAGAGAAAGEFDVQCDVAAAEKRAPRLARASIKTKNFPLDMIGGIVRRVSPGSAIGGRMTSDLKGHWNLAAHAPRDAALEGVIRTADFHAAGNWLGEDRLKLARAEVPCHMVWQGDELKVEKLDVACDLGTAQMAGAIDTSKNWIASLWTQPYRVNGEVKLAELARAMPNLIRLRGDTRITGGVVTVGLSSQKAGAGLEWQGQVDTTRLVAEREGKQIGWEHPVHVAFNARDTAQGTIIDRIYAQADFLELEGTGTPNDGHVSGSYNLDRLSSELGRFIDIHDLKLAGSGWIHTTWKQDGQGRWDADAELQVLDFALARPNRPAWAEKKLELTVALSGEAADRTVQRVDKATMNVAAGGDKLTARLVGPVAEFGDAGLWPLEIKLHGSVAKWQPRLDPWFDFPAGWNVAGDCDLTAQATWSLKTLHLERFDAKLHNLRGWGHGWFIDEPEAQLTGSAFWAGDRQRLEVKQAVLVSSAVAVEADDVVWALAQDGTSDVRGLVNYRGDLGRLAQWMHDPSRPNERQVTGMIDGEAVLSRTGSTTEARWQSTARDVTIAFAGQRPWKEAQIRLAGRGRHDRKADRITLTSFEVGSDALSLSAGGQITDLNARRNLELDGRLRYDLAKLEPLWQRMLGSELKIVGAENRAFSFRGPLNISPAAKGARGNVVAIDRTRSTANGVPQQFAGANARIPPGDLWLRQITGQASVGWEAIQVYGLGLGRGTADAVMNDGLVKVAPISVTASGGRVNLEPSIRVAPGPMQLSLAPGKAAEQIQITPQMCEQALKYVAPILAGVTQAQGTFSIQVDGAAIPLSNPKQGDIAGKMIVHSVDIGPGPLVQELAVLFNRAAPARLQRESVVDFRMVQGRIYHRGLELIFPDMTVRTYGSVGLDQTLSMVAEMPVPPKWIGNNRLGDAIKNQTIRLPLGGTLAQPRLDPAAMQQASAQFVRNAAGTAIEGEVQRQIDKQFQRLFGPPQ